MSLTEKVDHFVGLVDEANKSVFFYLDLILLRNIYSSSHVQMKIYVTSNDNKISKIVSKMPIHLLFPIAKIYSCCEPLSSVVLRAWTLDNWVEMNFLVLCKLFKPGFEGSLTWTSATTGEWSEIDVSLPV